MSVKITTSMISSIAADCSSGLDDQIMVEPAEGDDDIRLSIKERENEVGNVFLSLDDGEEFCKAVLALIAQLRSKREAAE